MKTLEQLEWVHLQFWPKNPGIKTAQADFKFRKSYKMDTILQLCFNIRMHEFTVKFRDIAQMVLVILAIQWRLWNRAGECIGTSLEVADHEFGLINS